MVRYLVKLTKGKDIKFISHLDYLKAVQRIIKRSNIPVVYSQGFNPHMEFSFAQPLAVGVYSQGDYLDLYLENELDKKLILKNLNENSDENIEFLNVKLIREENTQKSMAMLEACLYTIDLKIEGDASCLEEFKSLISKEKWDYTKATKTSEAVIDIKKAIIELNYTVEFGYFKIVTMLKSGSVFNLSPKLLAKFLRDNMDSLDKDSFPHIERIEMYTMNKNSYIPLYLIG